MQRQTIVREPTGDFFEAPAAEPPVYRPSRAAAVVAGIFMLLGAVAVTVGGVVHGQQWHDEYQHTPKTTPGWWVVRVGFPVDVALSALAVLGLLAAVILWRRLSGTMIALTVLFQIGALAAVVWGRNAAMFGWNEQGWYTPAKQVAIAEAAAIVTLAIAWMGRARARREVIDLRDRVVERPVVDRRGATFVEP